MSKPTLCVDFDGVVHSYLSGWVAADVIPDPPVPGALAWLLRALDHFDVAIYSSRSKSHDAVAEMKNWVRRHAHAELGENAAWRLLGGLKFAHEKPAAFLTIDDRAVCFEGDWSRLDPEELLKFKPWNKR